MKLGFIGLGHLGRAVAGRLLDSGHTLTVWNRTPSKTKGINAEAVNTPRDVSQRADIIFLCLFDSTAVRSVLSGEDGILSNASAGKVIVDLTTNHFRDATDFHRLCSKTGYTYLESPVLGSVVPASQGTLTVLVSGEQASYEKALPVLETIGKHIFYLKEPGLATRMKLINNLVLGSFMATIAEALSLGEVVGIAKQDILEILSAGAGNSLVLNAKKQKLLDEDFSTHFSNALMYKDIQLVQELAFEQKKPLFTGAVTKELFARTFEEGMDQEDFSSIYRLFRKS